MFVRWSNLTLEAEEQHRLPGYRDTAAVRRFDAPEALDTRFYEVHAKSVLNRVPEKSRMPFRWTVNPYRGCSHACAYCLGPETAVLLADGRTAPIADLEVGQAIYGSVREGAYRRFAVTEVLDKWTSVKPAYVVELEDGTDLIASADHRFLSTRGWKHVIGNESGPLQRPHLTLNNRLMGPGGCGPPPKIDEDYRRGYLCGVIRGDGTLRACDYRRPGRSSGAAYRFRLALADIEALHRTALYLAAFGVETKEFAFAAAAPNLRAMTAIRTRRKRISSGSLNSSAGPRFPRSPGSRVSSQASSTPRARTAIVCGSPTRIQRSSTG
jgi:hypothetical protein